MLRITAQHESSATRLLLEGKLSGACVNELARCWLESAAGETALVVDLTNISFVDEHGKELLARMQKSGTRLLSTSIMTKCLIADIQKNLSSNQ